jgi:hypothetical protein
VAGHNPNTRYQVPAPGSWQLELGWEEEEEEGVVGGFGKLRSTALQCSCSTGTVTGHGQEAPHEIYTGCAISVMLEQGQRNG